MPGFSHLVDDKQSSPLRLDRYVSEILCLFSRSQIKVRSLKAKLNGKEVKLSRLVSNGDHLELNWDDQPPLDIIPQDIPLEVIWEDEKCIVVNKTQGMVVHPGAGNRQNTLVNALCFRKKVAGNFNFQFNEQLKQLNNVRPGIVHRLDKETSGIIICAWDEETHAFLAAQFKTRSVKKSYIAIVCGIPKEKKGRIETFIARDPKNRKRFTVSDKGRHAVTFYKVIKQWRNYSLLHLRPKTGRTHQLRVHLRFIGYPILGDAVYGCSDKKFPNANMMLHSKSLEIILPGEEQIRIFSSPMPERFNDVIEKLNKLEGLNG
jgi:23S rRNA pseudouridine1911/1915/1917 synthase